MQSSNLILLGSVHSDPAGYTRTRAFLSTVRPDIVFVELSPYALAYRKENAPRLLAQLFRNLRTAAPAAGLTFTEALRHPRIRAISRQIALPFEYRASDAYAAHARGTRVVAVDWSEFSRQWIETWEELIGEENLVVLQRQKIAETPVQQQYDRAVRLIESGLPANDLWTGDDFALWRDREEHIASRIMFELAAGTFQRPLYIGGWRHLLRGGAFKTIRDILGIGSHGCFLLDRAAFLPGT